MALDVIGIGKPCVDLIVKVDHLPKSDESLPMQDFTMQGGGKVPTALVAAARLGTRAGFMGRVGDDTFGNFIVRDFVKHNIDISQVIREKGKISSFSVIVSDRESQGRSIIWERGTVSDLKWEDINPKYLQGVPFVHLAGSSRVEQQIARFARQNGSKVVYDADFYEPAIEEMLPWIDILIPSQGFADAYAQSKLTTVQEYTDVAQDLSKHGLEVVVITLGKEGAVGSYQGKSFYQEAFKVPVVDTTGAGDVFHGAFIAGLLQKRNFEDCTRFAAAVAALKTLALGGRAGIPTLNDVEKFLVTGQGLVEDLPQRMDEYKHALHYYSPEGL